MKKALSLLLSVLLVLSTITCLFAVTTVHAETAAVELISNGGFENTSLQPVGTNFPGISGTTNPSSLVNGKWYRATDGLSYATYGDLSAYDAETDTVTKATATEYAKYFTAGNTTITQPDDTTNHIGHAQQTMYQAINLEDGKTYNFKFKVRTTADTPYIYITLRGLQNQNTDGTVKVSDMTYVKMDLDVVNQTEGYTLTYLPGGNLKIVLDNPTEWTNVDIVAKVDAVAEPTPTRTGETIIETDFTMFGITSDSSFLNSTQGTNGYMYRTTGMYLDDISLRAYTDPFGEAEFYKDGKKLENSNEFADIIATVNGKETIGFAVGDTVIATPDYNADGNTFVGWYKNGEVYSREETITFTVNSTDVYAPKFISRNLLTETAGSFEGYANKDSLKITTTDYPTVGQWGSTANAGYFNGTIAETIYDVDGNAYTQEASGTRSVAGGTTAIEADAYRGNNALRLNCSYWSFATALDVTPNTDYTLTYYVKAIDTDTTKAPVNIKSGIVTTLNVGRNSTPTALGEKSLSGMSKQTLADYNNAYTLAKLNPVSKELVSNTWEKITLNFNSKNFETLYLGITPVDSERFWIDELTLVETNPEVVTAGVKFVDTKGNAIENANLYAKATVMEDIDGSNLLSIDYDDESGAYIFAGWYDSTDTRLSLDELYDYEGDLEGVYAKIISKNLFEASSFEGYENNINVAVSDMTKYPNEGEWGASLTAGYYKATYDEVIYDKYGYAYQQTASGTAGAYGAATITNAKAYKGSKSTLLAGNYATMVTGLDVEPNTNYTVTYYVLADTATTMKYTGIATTVNIAYQKAVTALDGGTLASGMTVAVGNMGDAYALSKLSALAVSNTEWLKVTHTFNSGDFEKLYLCICPTAGEKYYVDEISLVAEEKPDTIDIKFVDKDGNDLSAEELENVAADAIVETDIIEGTTTATINYARGAYNFLGWFNANDELVQTAESFTVTGSTDGMYAKIMSKNLLTYAASYEGYDVNAQLKYTGTDYPSGVYFGGNKNAGYLGATYEETIYDNAGVASEQIASGEYAANNINATVSSAKAHLGSKSIYLRNGFWTASMGLDVKPNTDYMLSYYILAPKAASDNSVNTIQLSAIATTVNTGTGSTVSAGKNAINNATCLYLDGETLTSVHDGENWVRVTHTFNSINLSKVYLIIGQTAYGSGAQSWAYIDDMTMIETTPTTMDVEMKNCASLDLIDADMDGLYVDQQLSFKVIENIGTAATVTFNGQVVTPSADGTYTVILGTENALSVRFEGDDDLPWYDEDEFGRKLSENNHEVYSEPVWEGDTVYHETALFTPDKDTVKLLYPVDSIVSLRSYDLTQNYIEGYDFEITDDGQIKRLEGGRIPVWTSSLTTDTVGDWKTNDGRYVVITGDTTYPKYAISVTYKHSTTFADGFTPAVPETQQADLNNVLTKLQNGEDVNIVIYGDSISCGWSSSGLNPNIKIYDDTNTEGNFKNYNINVAPYAPTWIQMLETELNNRYPDANINIKNLSLGGKSSPWGATNIAARLALWKDEDGNQVTPDLMLIGFGVNDSAGKVSRANFKSNIEAIIANARAASGNINMEALMYSPMFPNQDAVNWPAATLLGYEAAMEEIAAVDSNAGLLKLSSIFNEIVKNKAPEDYLNTNLNHGNDFTARLYYTGIMAAMTADENIKTTPDAPDAPVAESVTENSVTLVATEGYEYSMDGVIWQNSNVFENLEAETEYAFYQRVAETDTAYASNASALTVTTASAGIMGDVDGDKKINLNDLITLAQYVAGWQGEYNEAVMDVDNSGEIDLEDVTHLARYLAGWEGYTLG